MKNSGWRLCALAGLASLFLAGFDTHVLAALTKKNKVIIYPSANETISQLKQQGITQVDNYGSYWVAEADDRELPNLRATYGDRVVDGYRLDRIELQTYTIDTAGGEPMVPPDLQQTETKGRRLRLIQFKGPVLPKWLDQTKAIKNVEVVHYVANNAYLIFVDAETEKKLEALRAPEGPIQWIGAYHPYYKYGLGLQGASGAVDVRVAVVDAPEGRAALRRIQAYAERTSPAPLQLLDQQVISAHVDASALSAIARIPEVLWITPIIDIRPMDEVQTLILASRTNQLPGHSPVSGVDNYLGFLTNAVGGGLASFTDPETYPVVDIADSGFTPISVLADFGPLTSRVVYAVHDLSCGTFDIAKVTFTPVGTTNNVTCIAKASHVGGSDALAFAHGTAIASIIAGFNTSHQDPSGFNFGMGISPFGLIGSTRVFEPRIIMDDNDFCLYHVDDFFCTTDLGQLILDEYLRGARISNNSWGELLVVGENDGVYNARCQTYDIGVRDASQTGTTNTPRPFPLNQELIVVFANGNAGNHGNPGGGAGGFGDITLTSPASAKNVISVGAAKSVRLDGSGCPASSSLERNNSYDIAGYSAFGPTRDGRFKPEIVAPDTTIYAAGGSFWLASGALPTLLGSPAGFEGNHVAPTNVELPNGAGYVCGSGADSINVETPDPTPVDGVVGTSFAAPAVSGGIQLLWWYFQNRLAMLQPSPAMAKAYLLNSARYLPITNTLTGAQDTLPSIAQGMGMMDLRRMFDGVPRVIRDQSAPRALDTPLITTNPVVQQTYFTSVGQSFEWTGQVASNDLPFRVTLAWTDAPGDPANFIQLVNDLNLEVTVGGQSYKGNQFVGPNSVTGCPVPDNCPDHLNNTESVFLDPASTAAVTSGAPWKVVVRAATIAGDGVPHVGTGTDQDFAIVIYNSKLDSTLSDLPTPGTNDTCQTAQVISNFPYSTVLSNFPGTTFHNCQPSPTAGVGGAEAFWKLAQPTAGTVVNVDTLGSSFNTLLSVWKGGCGALIEEVSNNNISNTLQSAVTFTTDGSNDYYIVAEGLNNAGGTLKLNAGATAAPVNFVPASLDFGQIIVGLESAVFSAVLTNGTTQAVTVDTTTLGGANPGDFLAVEEGCAGNILPAGGTCVVSFRFAPTAIGSRSAQLTETDNAIGSPRLLSLSGTGLPPSPLVCLSTGGALTFTNQAVGTSSAVQSITLTNCGTAALTVSSVSLTGSGSNDFSVVETCTGGPIAAGGTCTLNVTFTPVAAGNRQATLTIAHDASGGLTTVTLQGTGFVPAPAVCVSASSLSFGSQGVGTTSAVQSVTITNCGQLSLTISNVAITGANPADFHVASSSCGVISTGSTCSVGVTFNPTTGGTRSALLAITNNAPGGPQLVSLTGLGSLNQPDAAIGKNTKLRKMIGLGTNSTTGVGEELVRKIKAGKKRGLRFFIALENAGSVADQFTVAGDGDGGGFTVKYFLGAADTNDITAAVESGTYATGTLAPLAITGDATMIRVEVKADKAVPKSTVKTFTVRFTSAGDSSKIDAVKATVITK